MYILKFEMDLKRNGIFDMCYELLNSDFDVQGRMKPYTPINYQQCP
jgi:hypothetical protein